MPYLRQNYKRSLKTLREPGKITGGEEGSAEVIERVRKRGISLQKVLGEKKGKRRRLEETRALKMMVQEMEVLVETRHRGKLRSQVEPDRAVN